MRMGDIRESNRYRVVIYVLTVSFVAAGVFAVLVSKFGSPNISQAVFFWILYGVAERLSVEGKVRGIPRAGLKPRMPLLSSGFLVLSAAALATDPATVAAIGFANLFVPGQWRGFLRGTFNSAQEALYGGAASVTFLLVRAAFGGSTLVLLIGAAVATLVALALNIGLVAGVMALERARGVFGVLREMAWPAVASLPFSLVALLIAILYQRGGPAAAIFILAPLLVLRAARRGKIELDTAQDRTLRAFVRAVELKDPYTSRHSERVAAIAVELHRELGAREEFLERRYYGALLHDIGKVAVSGRILTKADRLTPDEYEVVQRHPGTGAFVVSGVSFLHDVVPEILYHHERRDGTGYPSRLSGDDIPFEARVLAVADTFEALTSDRPYRRGLSHQEALAEIQRSAGSQLDPAPVAALARLLENGEMFPALPTRRLEESEPRHLAIAQEA
jgi:putative nucleotidyltransferase with HDIG domain